MCPVSCSASEGDFVLGDFGFYDIIGYVFTFDKYTRLYYLPECETRDAFEALIGKESLWYIYRTWSVHLVHAQVQHGFYSFVSIYVSIRYFFTLLQLTDCKTELHPGHSHWTEQSPECFSLMCCFRLFCLVYTLLHIVQTIGWVCLMCLRNSDHFLNTVSHWLQWYNTGSVQWLIYAIIIIVHTYWCVLFVDAFLKQPKCQKYFHIHIHGNF